MSSFSVLLRLELYPYLPVLQDSLKYFDYKKLQSNQVVVSASHKMKLNFLSNIVNLYQNHVALACLAVFVILSVARRLDGFCSETTIFYNFQAA